jgi:hypothetical protein
VAKIKKNIVLAGATGSIGGQVVVRQTKHGAVLAAHPGASAHPITNNQMLAREKFRIAVGYAKGAKDRPEYKQLAESRDLSTLNVATADFYHPPELTDVDVSEYEGKPGQRIWARAIDDVLVTEVQIAIANDQNGLIENGRMTRDPVDKTLWFYTATKDANTAQVKIKLEAIDLPKHASRKEVDKAI